MPSCVSSLPADQSSLPVMRHHSASEPLGIPRWVARKTNNPWCRRTVLKRLRSLTVLLVFGQLGCNERATAPQEGERPTDPGEQYSECTESADCAPLPFCVHPPDESGFCSEACAPAGDAESCPDSPGGSATTRCVDIGNPSANLCALDCNGSKTCPGGMRCQEVLTAEGARSLCF